MILSLLTHYPALLVIVGMSGAAIMGGAVGFLWGMAAFRREAVHRAGQRVSADYTAVLTRLRQDQSTILELRARNVALKAQFAEMTVHLARAMEAMK